MTTNTIGTLENSVISRFDEDGVVCLRDLFSDHWINQARAGIARNLKHPGPFFRDHTSKGSTGRYVFDFWNWQNIPEFKSFIFDSQVGAIAGQLMRAQQSTMIMDNWFMREKGASDGAPWHHDEPYFDFFGRMCVVWIPMENVSKQEGLTFIRASHQWDILFSIPQFSDNVPFTCEGDKYQPMPDIDGNPADYEFLSWDLDVGDCLVFDIRTLHCASERNRPLERTLHRLSLRFAAEDATFSPRGSWTKEITDHLIAKGQKPDQILDCPLLPTVWKK